MSRWVTHPYLCPPTCPACRDDDARAVVEEEYDGPDAVESRIEDQRERWAS